jgi:NAD+ diphosphatase
VAGFVEIGESLEGAVQREVMEEVGLVVANIRYYKSQPWAFSGSLIAGFFADVDGEKTITMDQNELSEALWMRREDILKSPLYDKNIVSITSEMIGKFCDGNYPK